MYFRMADDQAQYCDRSMPDKSEPWLDRNRQRIFRFFDVSIWILCAILLGLFAAEWINWLTARCRETQW
jgi:hypothetical protein